MYLRILYLFENLVFSGHKFCLPVPNLRGWITASSVGNSFCVTVRGGGVLPYMGYIGKCRCEGYGFQAV